MRKYIDIEQIPYITGQTQPSELDYVRRYVIERMPAADVQEVKHGRWIRKAYDNNCCSLCGWNVWVNTGKYCPNCGSRMDLEEVEK